MKLCYSNINFHHLQVDKTVASVLNENSMDYAVKFADLAEQITEPSQDGSRRKLGS